LMIRMFAKIALITAMAVIPQVGQAQVAEGNALAVVQEQEGAAAGAGAEAAHADGEEHGSAAHEEEHGFDILHHIQDAREIELPFGAAIHLPPEGSWMVGPLDMTPTKHVVFLWLTAAIVLLLFLTAARRAKSTQGESPRGGHNVMEALVLFFRDKVVMPNIGHGGEKFAPFVITLFFFILIANLLGLVPWGASATGNVSVTAALALMTLVVVEVAGMRALGPKGYIGTIVYIPHGLPKALVPIMALIMTPVELLGKLTKPFALAIRLFANMTAGHVLLLAIISLIFLFGSYAIAVGPVVMAIALTFLELFVAFLQAYIFALLTSVFIGLIRHAH
jgi:F-type H+-transporting ATPase subunit a